MSMVWNGQEIAGLALNGSAVSACYNGQIVWPAEQPIVYYNVTFGEGNTYSAGLTAEYNGQTVYSSPVGSSKRTATGIPSGAKITFCGSSPKYQCFTLGGLTGCSGTSVSYDGQRDGLGMTATGYLTASGNARLGNGHSKTYRVQGNWPLPGQSNGQYASIYSRPTSYSSWFGTAMSANSKLNIRSAWTANMVSHQGNSWGAGGNVTAAGWQPRNVSSHKWSGWCDTTGGMYYINGYLETAAGFQTIGAKSSAAYIARSWGETTNQNFFCAGRSSNVTTNKVVTAINGYWWDTGIAP